MRKGEVRLLSELFKDSKRSDRELARVLMVSQPTVTRTRHKLEKEGLVRRYTIMPDFVRMGFKILAVSCFKSRLNKESTEYAPVAAISKPNVVYAAECNGMGMNAVVVSLHKSYSDYVDFARELRSEVGDDLERSDPFIVSLDGLVFKPFDLKYLVGALDT